MNQKEYLKLKLCKDIENIKMIEQEIEFIELDLINVISNIENQIDKLESLKVDEHLILEKYIEYETLVKPITDLKSELFKAKIQLIDHYALLICEIGADVTYVLASRKDIVMMDKIIEKVKKSLKEFAEKRGFYYGF